MQIDIKSIGCVCNEYHSRPDEGWKDVVSTVQLDRQYADALYGLDEFSHIMVLFWLHQVEKQSKTRSRVHPMGKEHLPRVGVFATHSPARPNPIAVTVCRLLEIKGTALTVRGLDAYNQTPVLDIKSFTGGEVSGRTYRPAWVDGLKNEGG